MPGCCGEPACPNTGVAARGCGAGAWCTLACDLGCVGASATHQPGKQVWPAPRRWGGRLGVAVQPGLPVAGLFPAPLRGTAPVSVLSLWWPAVAWPWPRSGSLPQAAFLGHQEPHCWGRRGPGPTPARACPTLPHKQPKTTLLPADFPVRKLSRWSTAALQCCYRESVSMNLRPAPARRDRDQLGSGLSASDPAGTGLHPLCLGGQGARLALIWPSHTGRPCSPGLGGRVVSQSHRVAPGRAQDGLRTGLPRPHESPTHREGWRAAEAPGRHLLGRLW